MYHLTLLIFSLVISFVPFSVSLSSSVYRCIEWKETFRIALVFALFTTLMAAMGWGIGYAVKGLFNNMQVPVALFIMIFIAMRLFLDSRRKDRHLRIMISEDTRILFGFGMVISINPALLGISLGILYPGILPLMGFIFGTVFVMTIIGIRLGKLGLMNLGKVMEFLGSIVLILAGAFILLQYLKMV